MKLIILITIFFDKDAFEFHPSNSETKLINMNDNFILSGRA